MTLERLDAAMQKAGYQRTDDLDYDSLQADGAQESPPTYIRQAPTAAKLLKAGVTRIGRYDFERTMPGSLFHEECGYLHSLHRDGECPDEAEARAAFGDR